MNIRRNITAIALTGTLAVAAAGVAMAQISRTNVTFAKGTSSTVLRGTLKGDQTRDYVLRARAGQVMKVNLSGSPIVYFNVLPPGSGGEAIFIGSNEGNSFAGTLGVSGAYTVRVYQMRATARRGESGAYKLNIGIRGGAASSARPPATRPPAGGLRGIAGMNSINAIDAMTGRGFTNVDSFESGTTQYGIFYNRATRVCAQLTMADGKVLDARDIEQHPKCR